MKYIFKENKEKTYLRVKCAKSEALVYEINKGCQL